MPTARRQGVCGFAADVGAGQSELGPIRTQRNIVYLRVWRFFGEHLIGAAAWIPNPRPSIGWLARSRRRLDHLHEHERLACAIGDLGELSAIATVKGIEEIQSPSKRGSRPRNEKWRSIGVLPEVLPIAALAVPAGRLRLIHHLGRVAWTLIRRNHLPDHGDLLVPGFLEVVEVGTDSFLNERQQERQRLPGCLG